MPGNTIKLTLSRSSSLSPVTPNETPDSQRNLMDNLAFVSIRPNELPIKKDLQQIHHVNGSSNRTDGHCPDDLSIFNISINIPRSKITRNLILIPRTDSKNGGNTSMESLYMKIRIHAIVLISEGILKTTSGNLPS